jgi:hypothetical protein
VNIAIVEDHPMMRDILRRTCVEDLGHVVVTEACKAKGSIGILARSKASFNT